MGVDLIVAKFPGDRVFHLNSRPTEEVTSFKLEQKKSKRVHGIEFPFSLLMLRRYYATHLFDHGCPPEILSILLGHEHFSTTLGYVDTTGKKALRFHKKIAKPRLKK